MRAGLPNYDGWKLRPPPEDPWYEKDLERLETKIDLVKQEVRPLLYSEPVRRLKLLCEAVWNDSYESEARRLETEEVEAFLAKLDALWEAIDTLELYVPEKERR